MRASDSFHATTSYRPRQAQEGQQGTTGRTTPGQSRAREREQAAGRTNAIRLTVPSRVEALRHHHLGPQALTRIRDGTIRAQAERHPLSAPQPVPGGGTPVSNGATESA